MPFRARLVLVGASNLARDFPLVIDCAEQGLAPDLGTGPLQIFSACGHGRSYGTWSRVFLLRGLPGIAHCGLWPALDDAVAAHPEIPTFALLTDIGNDVAYGAPPDDITRWVESCLQRLAGLGPSVTTAVTLLPLTSLQRLRRWKFHLLRLLFFPTHPNTYERVQRRTVELQERLHAVAERFEVPALEPDPEWLGPDHIHFRRRTRRRAWREILGLWRPAETRATDHGSQPQGALPLPLPLPLPRHVWWTLTPELWTLAGIPLGREQPAGRLPDGSEVWLF